MIHVIHLKKEIEPIKRNNDIEDDWAAETRAAYIMAKEIGCELMARGCIKTDVYDGYVTADFLWDDLKKGGYNE